jgi:mono/diheme cytochrome c family protein
MRPRIAFTLGAALIAAAAITAAAQTTAPHLPPLLPQAVSGRELFDFYCASCHGRDAKGSGPVAAALKTPPADLTQLALRNDGFFPRARVEAFVAGGDAVAAHGTVQMPVWGPVFRALGASDSGARMRIANIVAYIETLQQPSTE